MLWLRAQPEGPAQGPAHPSLGTFGAPRRPGQREPLTCQVPLLGPGAHLTTTVIGKLADLMWMHVIHLFHVSSAAMLSGTTQTHARSNAFSCDGPLAAETRATSGSSPATEAAVALLGMHVDRTTCRAHRIRITATSG